MGERQPPSEQELERRAREIAEGASMTLGADVETPRDLKENDWGSPSSQFMEMLSRGAKRGFSRRDFAYGFVAVGAIGLFLAVLTRGEALFLRFLIPATVVFGVAFWFAGRGSFTLGEVI